MSTLKSKTYKVQVLSNLNQFGQRIVPYDIGEFGYIIETYNTKNKSTIWEYIFENKEIIYTMDKSIVERRFKVIK